MITLGPNEAGKIVSRSTIYVIGFMYQDDGDCGLKTLPHIHAHTGLRRPRTTTVRTCDRLKFEDDQEKA